MRSLVLNTSEAISETSMILVSAAGSSWRWALAAATTRPASFLAP
jgi:hypothetical protein